MGAERTRDELIPYLFGASPTAAIYCIELIDSDDEVLVVMAEQLGICIVFYSRHRQFPAVSGRTGVYRVRVRCPGEAVHNAGGDCP